MPAYLVRMKSNNEIVGLFVADDEESLGELVDECVSPLACEYLEMPEGGLFLSGSGAHPVPRDICDDEEVEFFEGANFTDSWAGIFFGTQPDDEAADPEWRSVPITETSMLAAHLGLD